MMIHIFGDADVIAVVFASQFRNFICFFYLVLNVAELSSPSGYCSQVLFLLYLDRKHQVKSDV